MTRKVSRLPRRILTIVCVDDGSTDLTGKMVKDFIASHTYKNCEIKLMTLKENVGKGGAIKAALMDAHADVYGFMDADLSIDFVDALPKTITALRSSDVVIGRRETATEYSWFRAGTTKCINSIVRFFLGTTVHDHQCGYKFFNEKGKDVATHVERTRFSFDVEFLARAQTQHLSISEVSVKWIHRDDSRVGMQDGFRFFLDLIAIVDLVEYKRFLRLLVTCSAGIVAALFFWVPFYGAFFSDDYTWLWKGSLILH
ncbi:MAG: glycosyltransferase, partial [Candidatus Magasanikbacteria bacterium]|nr:glycosyltransferase [Candidatus Magasanikbacteria bacterium]